MRLTHSPAEGTLLHGTSKGDGTAEVLRSVRHVARWQWSGNLDAWYIPRSRDRRVYQHQLDATAAALREAGFDVELEVGDERRPVAEQEADRAGRSAARADRLTERAATLQASGEAGWAAAREFASRIPFGQPILVGHHSEGRHRRDLARIDRMEDKAIEQLKGGEEAARQAAAAEAALRHRENGATTVRRIEKLEADLRRAERGMTQRQPWTTDEQHAASVAHWTPIAEELEERLTYWREYLRGLVEAGVYRVWSRADFTKGDYVLGRYGWSKVLRVNAKSVTIPHIHERLAEHGHTWTLSYDEVRGRRSAEDPQAGQETRG
jgi:hypothetical protein